MKQRLNTLYEKIRYILFILLQIIFGAGFILFFALSVYSLFVYGDGYGMDFVIKDIIKNGLIFFQ